MRGVDAAIRHSLHSQVSLINQISEYIINGGGKRLRPALVLLCSGLIGSIDERHHKLAAIIEFIHTATLLHDDVVDDSEMRRGRATANTLFGNAASVLVGDFIYSRSFQLMVSLQNMRIMEVLSDATNVIAEGEVLQLLNCHNADIADEDYLKVIHFKTAKLFEAACRLGAIINGASVEDEERLAAYGRHLGTAFQLVDDVLDITGDAVKIGKNLGDDLLEGKPTLPLLIAMRTGTASQAQLIRHAIENGSGDDLTQVIEAVQQTESPKQVIAFAEREIKLAVASLAPFADNIYKLDLLRVAQMAVHRSS